MCSCCLGTDLDMTSADYRNWSPKQALWRGAAVDVPIAMVVDTNADIVAAGKFSRICYKIFISDYDIKGFSQLSKYRTV